MVGRWDPFDKWVYKFLFEVVLRNIGIWQCTDGSHSTPFSLQIVGRTKIKLFNIVIRANGRIKCKVIQCYDKC